MISFCKIGCKGTTFYAYSQIKCTKTAQMCTFRSICATILAIIGSKITKNQPNGFDSNGEKSLGIE